MHDGRKLSFHAHIHESMMIKWERRKNERNPEYLILLDETIYFINVQNACLLLLLLPQHNGKLMLRII